MIATVNERTTSTYQFTLINEKNEPVPIISLSSLTMTLYDKASDTVINGRADVDIKNANGGTYAPTSGVGVVSFVPEDHVIVGTGLIETHVALFTAVWDQGELHWELSIRVNNLHRVA